MTDPLTAMAFKSPLTREQVDLAHELCGKLERREASPVIIGGIVWRDPVKARLAVDALDRLDLPISCGPDARCVLVILPDAAVPRRKP